jgi:anti-sigma28 factor (negative regulator of flagellin synthesis)
MKINSGGYKPVRPDATRDVHHQTGETRDKPSSGVERQDTVEISEAGRAKAAELSSSTGPERLKEIRERVLRGAYDTDAVVAHVARRILELGDV